MGDPADCTAFNRQRYAWVNKRFQATEVVEGGTLESAVVTTSAPCMGNGPTARLLKATVTWIAT